MRSYLSLPNKAGRIKKRYNRRQHMFSIYVYVNGPEHPSIYVN